MNNAIDFNDVESFGSNSDGEKETLDLEWKNKLLR